MFFGGWQHASEKAILHIDGDSFFANCEIAVNPALKGRPVVTGKERGIASAMSYEAKKAGVTRGMIISEVLKRCPTAVVLPSDYETYSLFSRRMYAIVRRYTSDVEEYSIDECFADITGLRRPLKKTYVEIAKRIQWELAQELGMTFSVGLAPNKVLAKVASKRLKPEPGGFTVIHHRDIHAHLAALPVGKLWGIGTQTSALLGKYGIYTAGAFAAKDQYWVEQHLAKPYQEIWRELNGEFIYELNQEEAHTYQSISKTKTFSPASTSPDVVYAQLTKNIANACIKARRHSLLARRVAFFLKTQDFTYHGYDLTLTRPAATPEAILALLRPAFDQVFRAGVRYRATGIVLMDLTPSDIQQPDLFGGMVHVERMQRIYAGIDNMAEKYGKHAVLPGSALAAMQMKNSGRDPAHLARRESIRFRGETSRQRIGVPLLGEVR